MKKKLTLAIAALVSILPVNALRCLGYRLLFGYTIRNSRIGLGTMLVAENAHLENCHIGRFNQFLGPMSVSIGSGARIGNHNTFTCGSWTKTAGNKGTHYERALQVGADVLITSNHFFDIAGSLNVGRGSWIAGQGSQFWTHGAGASDRNISIGESCYIGSAVRFAPGSGVGDNVIVGLGSVVTNRIEASSAMIAGVPARVIRENYHWKLAQIQDSNPE